MLPITHPRAPRGLFYVENKSNIGTNMSFGGSLSAVSCDGAAKSVITNTRTWARAARHLPFFCRGPCSSAPLLSIQTKPSYKRSLHYYNTQAPEDQTQIASLYLSLNIILELVTRRINTTHSKSQTLLPTMARDDTTYRGIEKDANTYYARLLLAEYIKRVSNDITTEPWFFSMRGNCWLSLNRHIGLSPK